MITSCNISISNWYYELKKITLNLPLKKGQGDLNIAQKQFKNAHIKIIELIRS